MSPTNILADSYFDTSNKTIESVLTTLKLYLPTGTLVFPFLLPENHYLTTGSNWNYYIDFIPFIDAQAGASFSENITQKLKKNPIIGMRKNYLHPRTGIDDIKLSNLSIKSFNIVTMLRKLSVAYGKTQSRYLKLAIGFTDKTLHATESELFLTDYSYISNNPYFSTDNNVVRVHFENFQIIHNILSRKFIVNMSFTVTQRG